MIFLELWPAHLAVIRLFNIFIIAYLTSVLGWSRPIWVGGNFRGWEEREEKEEGERYGWAEEGSEVGKTRLLNIR